MPDEKPDAGAAVKTKTSDVGVCPTCQHALTQLGPEGECLRCVMSWAFAPEQDVATSLRYGHFEVELDDDGTPAALGAGAMAVTYRARDTVLNSVVALKVIGRNLADNPMARTRFLREARAAAQIHHPNVARVIHYGEQDGECFYAMELVEGETLEARVKRTGPMPVSQALEVIEQATRALAAAETCGVVHRDLKPSNVMIESDSNGALLVKIIDYGVAKVLAAQTDPAEQTQIGFIGTPAFASPEQFGEKDTAGVDARSDIYSLGATLWFLLTGRTPISGKTPEEIRASHHELPLEQLKGARVPTAIVELLKRMLARDPARRPQSASELLEAVHRAYLRFEPRAALRRKRVIFAAAVAAVAVALATALAFFYPRAPSPAPAERSIAVLPFKNLSEDQANEFFAEGVQDQILTNLGQIADLKVVSRTSAMQYKTGAPRNLREIGRQLGVVHVVEGSVQRAGNKVRVIAQLIDARNDAHLWAQTYDRDLADVFTIQSEIAKAIADQLQAKLSPNEKKAIEQPPTTDLAAFDLYTRAKSLLLGAAFSLTRDADRAKAAELLNEAVRRDPAFFDAYCALAVAHEQIYAQSGSDHTPARLALAQAAVQGAARLRPDAAETHLARAQYLYYGLRNYADALTELNIARQGLPNDPRVFEMTAYILRRHGDQEEGLRNLQRAVELDPRNVAFLQQLTLSYQFLGRYPQAIVTLDRVLQILPESTETHANRDAYYLFGKADIEPLRRTKEAFAGQPGADNGSLWGWAARDAASLERGLAQADDGPYWAEGVIILSRDFGEGVLGRMTNDEPRARAAFARARAEQEKLVAAQPDYGPALCTLAMIDAALGQKELAFEEGRRAIALLPVEKDAVDGSRVLQYFAITLAWAGEKDLALEQLEAGVRAPVASAMLSYGALKLFPIWDPLRGDARFEAIVQRLAPKL
jgi:TolB-like protein/tRNA A-37 threonylcarbamoyl transferase component Bud32/Tfp pilus assembly protein PilF